MTESAGNARTAGGDTTRRNRARAAEPGRDSRGWRKLLRVVWPFAVLTACLVLLAALSMELLSATRSFVGGEGLWSKGQKEAVYSLSRFADSRAEGDFRNYLTAIAIPLGDRKARLELERPDPDLAVIRAGFLEGRNQPEDVPGMIRLYRLSPNVGFMARAIDVWSRADGYIVELTAVAEQLHQEIARATPNKARITALLADIDRINGRLTPLEDEFSQTLGEGARLTRGILFLVIALASALLLAIAVLLTRRFLRRAATLEHALRRSEERYALAVEGSHDGLWDWDIAANRAYYSPRFMQMLGYAPGQIKPEPRGYEALVHPDDLARALQALEQHQQRDIPYAVEYRLRTGSGAYRWFQACGQTVRGADGAPARMAGSITDITERKQAEDALRRVESQLRDIQQALPFPILVSRLADHVILYANDYAVRQFRLTGAGATGEQSVQIFVNAYDRSAILESLRHGGAVKTHEVQMRDRDGHAFWALVSAQIVTYADEQCVLIALYDITERKQRDDHIRRMAFRDPLTRLPNRASFDQNVSRALALAETSGKRLALLFVDLDEFKMINDTHGHKGGDRMLQAIAIRLANSLRKTDFAARVGGDEFIVLFPEITDLESVAGLATKLLARISKPLLIEDRECRLTASIGISFFPEDGADVAALLKAADIAMYRAKGAGKNTFRFHSIAPRFDAAGDGLPEFSPAGQRGTPA